MKLDKKQLPQLVVLGLLVLLCIGYMSFTVLKPPATEPPPPAKSAQASAAKALVHVAAEPIPVTGAFPDLSAPIPRRDPFTIQTLDTPAEVQLPKPISPKATAVITSVVRAASSRVPPLMPIGSFSPGHGLGPVSGLSVVPSVENQDPDFVLTGVIRGIDNVAIIRVGGSERHVVMQGQTINGRYRVLYVSQDGVVLGCKDRRIHLKLGGVPNAS